MNDADVSKQIQQMVRFIRQEAEEKANEISVSAEEVLSLSLTNNFLNQVWCLIAIWYVGCRQNRILICLWDDLGLL